MKSLAIFIHFHTRQWIWKWRLEIAAILSQPQCVKWVCATSLLTTWYVQVSNGVILTIQIRRAFARRILSLMHMFVVGYSVFLGLLCLVSQNAVKYCEISSSIVYNRICECAVLLITNKVVLQAKIDTDLLSCPTKPWKRVCLTWQSALCLLTDATGPFHYHGLTLIPPWINNHVPSKVSDEIIYPFPILYGG